MVVELVIDDGIFVDIYESVKERIPERNTQGLSRGDYLRIASAGLDILGAPGETGGILGGTLSAASKPLSKLGVDLGTSMDARQQAELDRREELARTLTGAEVEREIGLEKAKGVLGFKKKEIDDMFAGDIEEAIASGDKESIKALQAKKRDYIDKYVIRGLDDSDFLAILKNQTAVEQAEGDARRILANTINPNSKEVPKENWKTTDKGYTALKNEQKFRILRETANLI